MEKLRYSVFLNLFDSCGDRYCTEGYGQKRTLKEQVEAAKGIDRISGVDLVVYRDTDYHTASRLLKESGLKLASVLPDISCDPVFKQGALTSQEAAVRQRAVQKIKEAMDFAAAQACPSVTIWPGQDGFDYLFQADYQRDMEFLKEGLKDCAAHRRDVTLHLEYKPCEPRTHSYLDSCASAIALIQAVGKENLGVAVDFGHTLMDRQPPAESLALCRFYGIHQLHVHINDCFGQADDDMIPGSVNTLQYVEFFYWLRQMDYQGYITFDQFPYREDAIEAVQEGCRWLDALWEVSARLDREEVRSVWQKKDGVGAVRLLRNALFSLF